MAFPTTSDSPRVAVERLLNWARSLRQDAARYVAQCDSGSLRLHDVASALLANHLGPAKQDLALIVAVPGVYDELARQFPARFVESTSAQAAVTAVISAVDGLIVWLETNIPVDAQRRILSLELSNDGTGRLTQRTITVQAQLDAFKAQLIAFRDAFEA